MRRVCRYWWLSIVCCGAAFSCLYYLSSQRSYFTTITHREHLSICELMSQFTLSYPSSGCPGHMQHLSSRAAGHCEENSRSKTHHREICGKDRGHHGSWTSWFVVDILHFACILAVSILLVMCMCMCVFIIIYISFSLTVMSSPCHRREHRCTDDRGAWEPVRRALRRLLLRAAYHRAVPLPGRQGEGAGGRYGDWMWHGVVWLWVRSRMSGRAIPRVIGCVGESLEWLNQMENVRLISWLIDWLHIRSLRVCRQSIKPVHALPTIRYSCPPSIMRRSLLRGSLKAPSWEDCGRWRARQRTVPSGRRESKEEWGCMSVRDVAESVWVRQWENHATCCDSNIVTIHPIIHLSMQLTPLLSLFCLLFCRQSVPCPGELRLKLLI